jgi:asparagine synthase (glutamine-hydrolysing)
VPSPDSIYRETHKVPPGSFAVFDENSRGRVAPYWSLIEIANQEPFSGKTEQEHLAELKTLLTDAVRRRLMGDVPLGAFLSGGIDSSLVVALMKETGTGDVRTFTIGFRSAQFDESKYAVQVAQQLGVENTLFMMEGSELLGLLPELVRYYDEPMADYSSLCTMAVSRLARQHVKVVLTGDGGDEFFGGYEGYLATKFFTKYAAVAPRFARRAIAKLSPLVPHRRLRDLVHRSQLSDAAEFHALYSNVGRHVDLSTIVPSERLCELPQEEAARFIRSRPARSAVESAMLYDATHNMIDAILHKADRATMAFALEARCPLLDKQFTEYAVRLPMSLRVHGWQKKYVLRKLLSKYLPWDLIVRSKTGFTPPLRDWFRVELREMLGDLLSPSVVRSRGYFHAEGVSQLVDQHLSGTADHTYLLWSLLMLEMWFRNYIDPGVVKRPLCELPSGIG